jgi:hypothetical protein
MSQKYEEYKAKENEIRKRLKAIENWMIDQWRDEDNRDDKLFDDWFNEQFECAARYRVY